MASYEGLPEIFAPSVAEATGDIRFDPSFGGKVKPTQETLDRIESSRSIDPNVLGKDLPAPIRNLMNERLRLEGKYNLPSTDTSETYYQRRPISDTPTRLPGDQPQRTTNALGDLVDVLRTEIKERGSRQDRIISDEYLDAQMRRRQQELAYATDLLSKAQMGQMKEKTRRDVIDGWRKIQQEKIRANTIMATAMMNTAYLAATPNANVLSALNVASDSAMRAFQPGQAVN
tara:strand:- start:125 stop:817 length:693 start_codon:yes stop_codon:yes gene_type:complete